MLTKRARKLQAKHNLMMDVDNGDEEDEGDSPDNMLIALARQAIMEKRSAKGILGGPGGVSGGRNGGIASIPEMMDGLGSADASSGGGGSGGGGGGGESSGDGGAKGILKKHPSPNLRPTTLSASVSFGDDDHVVWETPATPTTTATTATSPNSSPGKRGSSGSSGGSSGSGSGTIAFPSLSA